MSMLRNLPPKLDVSKLEIPNPARSAVGLREALRTRVRWGTRHGIPSMAVQRGAKDGKPGARLIAETAGTTIDELVPLLHELREAGPTLTGPLSTITVDHALAKQVLNSPKFASDIYSRVPGIYGKAIEWSISSYVNPIVPPSLLAVDGEQHARYRKLVTRVFSVKAVEKLRERTQEIADELLDDLQKRVDAGESFDLVTDYCALLPVTVICEVLGVPLSERDTVLHFGEASSPVLDLGLPWDEFKQVENSLDGFDTWLGNHLESLRANPGDDLLSQLVAAQDEGGVGLTERELRSIAGLVLAAGFETTVNLLSNGISLLKRNPEQLDTLAADPGLWSNAVDEVLRFDPPVLLTGRVAVETVEVGEYTLGYNDSIVTVLAGVNRDPNVFDDPDTFDVSRVNARDHMSFSFGSHYCLGASLARMEGEVGLRSLMQRFPDLELLPGAERRSTRILRGFKTLPARVASRE